MNRLLEQLRAQYGELVRSYDDILDRCANEGRDPSDTEATLLDSLRGELEPLGERIVQMRDTDSRRLATMTALADYPQLSDDGTHTRTDAGDGGNGNGRGAELITRAGGPGSPIVRVNGDELVYRRDGGPDGDVSFFRDLVDGREGDRGALDRIERHNTQMRALGTTATGAGAVPPVWLPEEFAEVARGSRPVADTLRRVPITSATPVTVGVQSAGAIVGTQANEGDPPVDGSFVAAPLVTTPKTKTGKIDVTRQLIDGSNPAVDTILYGDLLGAYAEQVEAEVLAALAAQGGIAATETPATVDEGIDAITDAATAVRQLRKRAATHVFCTHAGFGALSKIKDSAGRPLITTGRYGPNNAQGLAEPTQYADIAGEVIGLAVVPTWAGAGAGDVWVVRAIDLLLLESATLTFRYEEVLGPEQIRLGVWGYVAAVTGRYPKAIAKVTLPGVVAPTSASNGEGDEAEAASSRSTSSRSK